MLIVDGIIILDRVPKFIVNGIYDIRDGNRSNLIRKVSPMYTLSQEVIGVNKNQRGRFYTIRSTKEGLLSAEKLVMTVLPYILGGLR